MLLKFLNYNNVLMAWITPFVAGIFCVKIELLFTLTRPETEKNRIKIEFFIVTKYE